MYARVATFESDPSLRWTSAIAMVGARRVAGDTPCRPRGREDAHARRIARAGKGVGITLFESEDAMRRGDEALNAMSPGGSERRVLRRVLRGPGRDGDLGHLRRGELAVLTRSRDCAYPFWS